MKQQQSYLLSGVIRAVSSKAFNDRILPAEGDVSR